MRAPALRRMLARRSRRRIFALLALLVAIGAVFVVVTGALSSSPTKSDASANTPAGATTVSRRDLVQTDTESGTLSYASPQTVYDRLTGTITWLPSVGQVIKPGGTLFKVAGQPVTLMDGAMPAYRDLGPSDGAGQDILQLNRNLVRLGFNPDGIEVDDTWQAATTAGVDVLQAYLGESETGILSLGQVVFLPGTQLVSSVETTLGSTGASSGTPSSGSDASNSVQPSRAEFVDQRIKPRRPKPGPKRRAGGKTRMQTLQALIALLQAEIAELKAERAKPTAPSSSGPGSGKTPTPSSGKPSTSGGAAPSSSNAGTPASSDGGGGGGSASAVLQTASTKLIVTVDLDASKQSEAKVGETVSVELPDGSTVGGKVSAVSPVAQSSSNSNSGNGNGSGNGSGNGGGNANGSSGAVIPVTVTLTGHRSAAALDQAAVSVNFAQAQARNVLSVPVTALLATAGGGYAVQEAAPSHAVIPVTTGLFAAGYVQISGAGIYQGLEVTDSQG